MDKLHVNQFRAGMVGEGLSVTGVFPGVAGDSIGAPNSARSKDDGLRFENLESSAFPIVPERAGDSLAMWAKGG